MILKEITNESKALQYALHYGFIFDNFPMQFMTPEICLAAVYCNPCSLEQVPSCHKTEDLCRIAVNVNGIALRFVPRDMIDESLCFLAIRTERYLTDYAEVLSFVPNEFMSRMLCLEAVERNGTALKYVPDDLKHFEICLAAVKSVKNELMEEVLGHVPKRTLDSPDFWLYAVKGGTSLLKNDPLRFVPDRFKTQDVCLAAVQTVGTALEFVPDNLKTKEMCVAALKSGGEALEYVPEKLQPKLREWLGWVGGENEAP
jgi:hypothetical protein